jgi:cytochrome c553
MRKISWLVAAGVVTVLSIGVATQTAQMHPDKPWAFPAKVEKPFPEDPKPRMLEGSTRTYTMAQIDDLHNPPDWFPDQHPMPPDVVVKGDGSARMACGACHLMSGLGHPESANLAGLNADYIVQQIKDFRSGTRVDPMRMSGIAKAVTDEQAAEAAKYFASLPRRPFGKVMESAEVPRTVLRNGRMRYVAEEGGMEPIGTRVITVPENADRARQRDPYSGFITYAPVGSLALGKTLVETGGGKTIACTVCHGPDLRGFASIPALAGAHPVYTARQLYWFKDGSRNGAMAAQMKPVVTMLTDEDIVAISAYLGSIN